MPLIYTRSSVEQGNEEAIHAMLRSLLLLALTGPNADSVARAIAQLPTQISLALRSLADRAAAENAVSLPAAVCKFLPKMSRELQIQRRLCSLISCIKLTKHTRTHCSAHKYIYIYMQGLGWCRNHQRKEQQM